MSLEAQFQREVNRALDADRNTRKRGFQKLFESLPWEKKSTKAELIKFIDDYLLKVCIGGISDEVEKCREYSLKIIKEYFGLLMKKNVVTPETLLLLLQALYARVNDTPFPEVAEELRLLVLELLLTVLLRIKPLLKESGMSTEDNAVSLAPVFNNDLDRLVLATTKILGDNFPAVKRAAADLMISMCKSKALGTILRSHSKALMRALVANTNHQHSKTRSVTLQAIVSLLLVLQSQDSFAALWKEFVYPAFQRSLSDRTPTVRKDMVDELTRLLQSRIVSLIDKQKRMLSEEDLQAVMFLLLLCGDEVEEISAVARKSVITVLQTWKMPEHTADTGNMDVDESVENAELALRGEDAEGSNKKMVIEVVDSSSTMKGLTGFLQSSHGPQLVSMLLQGVVDQWTVDGKSQSLRGIASFFSIVYDIFHIDPEKASSSIAVDPTVTAANAAMDEDTPLAATSVSVPTVNELVAVVQLLDSQLPIVLHTLLPLMRHEEEAVRHAGESVARRIGQLYPIVSTEMASSICIGSNMNVWMDLVMPRVRGEISGTDTSSQRAMSIRLALQLYRGSMEASDFSSPDICQRWQILIGELISSLARQRSLWSQFHNDVPVKEAIILYIRTIFLQHHTPPQPSYHQATEEAKKTIQPPQEIKERLTGIRVLPSIVQRDVAQIYLYLMSAPSVQSLASQYQQGTIGSNASANSAMGGGNGDIERIARRDFLQFVQQYHVQQDESASSSSSSATFTNPNVANKDETLELMTIGKVLQPHFISLFVHIVTPYLVVTNGVAPPSSSYASAAATSASAAGDNKVNAITEFEAAWVAILQAGNYSIQWESMSVDLLCLQTLCQFCLLETWRQWSIVLPLFAQLLDPSHGTIAAGSMKDTMITYASQRGEDTTLTQESLISYDQRMHILILLEQLIRIGTTSGHFWEAGSFISQSTSVLMARIFLPNLIWRVGRVEGTIRKIALAGVYALFKAGAIPREVILSVARETLPVLVSHLDDMDVSPRLMACLSLAVFFARLGAQGCVGIWDELGLKDIYPKFLARLDDSQDEVRMASCQLLSSFVVSVCGKIPTLASGGKQGSRLMSDTMVEYIIDQLFIHLDDMNQAMQEQVYNVLLTIALQCEGDMVHHQLSAQHFPKNFAQLIMKKADQQKFSHRSPKFCEKLIMEIETQLQQTDSQQVD